MSLKPADQACVLPEQEFGVMVRLPDAVESCEVEPAAIDALAGLCAFVMHPTPITAINLNGSLADV